MFAFNFTICTSSHMLLVMFLSSLHFIKGILGLSLSLKSCCKMDGKHGYSTRLTISFITLPSSVKGHIVHILIKNGNFCD